MQEIKEEKNKQIKELLEEAEFNVNALSSVFLDMEENVNMAGIIDNEPKGGWLVKIESMKDNLESIKAVVKEAL